MFRETRGIIAVTLLLVLGWAYPSATLPQPKIKPTPPDEAKLGLNLGVLCSWTSHLIFVDAMMRARPWIPFPPNTTVWDAKVPVPMDRHRMPKKIPFVPEKGGSALAVRTMFYDGLDGQYPAGKYVLSFEGSGEIHINGDPGFHKFSKPGRYPILVKPGNTGWFLEIHRSDEKNPIRNLHVWLPGFENAKNMLHPMATYRMEGFSAIRAMQTMALNTGSYPCHNGEKATDPNCVNKWSDRTTPDLYTQHWSQGMALEYVIALANQAGTDLWPGIPHAADDEWVRNAALMIRERLDPKLKVYVELSNETWNSSGLYPQHYYFRELGRREKLFSKDHPEDDTETGRRAFVQRSVQVYKIFEEVFAESGSQRLIKVMPAFFGWSAVAESLMKNLSDKTLNPSGVKVDALAVGAYVGVEVKDMMKEDPSPITVTRLLDKMESVLGVATDGPKTPTFVGFTKAHALIARKHNLSLIAYEGGQHLLGSQLGSDSPVHEVIYEANRSPRMEKLYDKLFKYWYGAGGQLFLAYAFIDRYSWYGAFGHLEHTLQPLELAPKFRALRRQLQKSGGKLNPPVTQSSMKKHLARWRINPAGK
ncbi:MAG: hypothetical protein KTR25_11140 [Myxococcales bacterium]|nr:hypothetical protein [Myxococcales bacterium]